MKARFGENNQRVVALRFLYESAVADDKDLRRVLEDLEKVLKEDRTSLVNNSLAIHLVRTKANIISQRSPSASAKSPSSAP